MKSTIEYGVVIHVDGVSSIFTFDCEYDALNFARQTIHIQGIEKTFVFEEDVDDPIFQFQGESDYATG
jgi:methylase of polypeptide subunit release factors